MLSNVLIVPNRVSCVRRSQLEELAQNAPEGHLARAICRISKRLKIVREKKITSLVEIQEPLSYAQVVRRGSEDSTYFARLLHKRDNSFDDEMESIQDDE